MKLSDSLNDSLFIYTVKENLVSDKPNPPTGKVVAIAMCNAL